MPSAEEPVWFVRIVILLMLVGFAMFLATEGVRLVEGIQDALRRAAAS